MPLHRTRIARLGSKIQISIAIVAVSRLLPQCSAYGVQRPSGCRQRHFVGVSLAIDPAV